MSENGRPGRLGPCLAGLRARARKALIPFVTAGDPDLGTTARLVHAMAAAGADVIELGVPFSDPLADGPVIQAASQRALAAGTTLRSILAMVEGLRREGVQLPLCLMSYYNPIFRFGAAGFAGAAAAAGVDGLIVPDLPLEEAGDLYTAGRAVGVDLVPFIAPTSPAARIRMAGEAAAGFIYCVSLTGVTGVQRALADQVAELVAAARAHTSAPLAVGFGIRTPAEARQVAAHADGVIVGSALVEHLAAGDADAAVAAVAALVGDLRRALDA